MYRYVGIEPTDFGSPLRRASSETERYGWLASSASITEQARSSTEGAVSRSVERMD